MRIPRPSYAGVTATLAVFLALGGTSYAALSISGKNIRNGTVTGSDLKDGSVQSRDVDNGSLLAKDFAAGQLPAGPAGPQGPAGPAGPQGPAGAQGPPGVTNVVTRRENVAVAAANPTTTIRRATVSCPAGEIATGGGAAITSILSGSSLIIQSGALEADGTAPEDGEKATGWEAVGANSDSGQAQVMAVYVHCATP